MLDEILIDKIYNKRVEELINDSTCKLKKISFENYKGYTCNEERACPYKIMIGEYKLCDCIRYIKENKNIK